MVKVWRWERDEWKLVAYVTGPKAFLAKDKIQPGDLITHEGMSADEAGLMLVEADLFSVEAAREAMVPMPDPKHWSPDTGYRYPGYANPWPPSRALDVCRKYNDASGWVVQHMQLMGYRSEAKAVLTNLTRVAT